MNFPEKLSDNELVALLQQDELSAFIEIYNRYWDKLFNAAYKRIKKYEICEEIVQDVFANFWSKREGLVLTTGLSNYLFTAIRNQVIDHYRKQVIINNFMFSSTDQQFDNSNEQTVLLRDLQQHIESLVNMLLKQILPDKSIVWLDPQAMIAFPKVFNKNFRNLVMEGGCFFEVSKDAHHPFIIRSKHLITKVWGTSFKISDKKDMDHAQVTVVTGKVSVSVQGNKVAENEIAAGEVILLPKQKVVFENENNTFYTTRQADMSDLNRYVHIDLLFDNEKLSQIVEVLNKKFNANIRIEDKSLKNQVMDADLSGLNLPEVLDVLKASLQLNYEMSNDVIILKKPVKL